MLIFDQLNKADRHLRVLSWSIALGLIVLLAGLWWVQVVRSREFVEDQLTQSYRTVRVPAPRGKIMDRNGLVLAENRPIYNISIYLEDTSLREAVQQHLNQIRNAARLSGAITRKPNLVERALSWFGYKPVLVLLRRLPRAESTELLQSARYTVVSNIVAQLSAIIGQTISLDEARLRKHYEQRLVLPFPILSGLNEMQIARVQERGLNLPGVDMEIQPTRKYPQETLAAHVLGSLIRYDESVEGELAFFNYKLPDYRGYCGVEASFDSELRGQAGAKSVLVNNLGYRQTDTTLSPVEAGKNLTLTIDAEIQREAEHALASADGALPIRGAAVVLDVRTGEVIALASVPTFNPNEWIPFLPHPIANSYTNEATAPLRNRAVYGNYAPGSTFKIFVALAGLEAGTLNPDEPISVPANPHDPAHGIYYVGPRRHPFKDTAQPGDYKFLKAFIRSSNGYFIEQGQRAKPERIVAIAEQFHFGERTGIPLLDSRGLLPTSEWVRKNRGAWSPPAIGNLSIGQGDLDVTPLQLAVAVAAVANGGRVLAPQLVMSIRGPDELIAPNQPGSLRPIIRDQVTVSSRSLNLVRQAMLADVEDQIDGSGKAAFIRGFRVCGKTGTAQAQHGARMDHYLWFASYGPFEDPRYSVVVMLESDGSGGRTCAPVAKQIYEKLKAREEKLPPTRKDSFARN